MQVFTSILFVLLFLVKGMVPNMNLECELQKIPNLWGHYQEHKECNGSSFFGFLADHYGDDQKSDKDQNHDQDSEHEKLPFHGTHKCCHPAAFYTTEQQFELVLSEHPIQYNIKYYLSFFSSEFLDSFFQPPKV